jgi:RNA-splicing ligase RtcB
MIVKGKYGKAIIYADIFDEGTNLQVKTLLDQKFTKGLKVRIMPDCHSGNGCVIGTTMTIKDKIVPNLVGVDIGCGMLCVKLGKIDIDLVKLDEFIHKYIPAGQNVNEDITLFNIELENLKCFNKLKQVNYLKKSIGSLGGGNHFIEVDIALDGSKYLIIHTGSRNLGCQVAEIYQNKAIQYHEDKIFNKKLERERVIKEYKEQGLEKQIQAKLKEIEKKEIVLPMPKELCYLEGKDFDDYMHDMHISQEYAKINRIEIAKRILTNLNLNLDDLFYFETVHNYINMDDKILRKGAISAYKDETVLIPINMKDGCIIAKGKSNKKYNCSAPHGAGRLISRGKALKTLSLEEYQKSMEGIYSTTVNKNTLDEAPMAYKPIESILKNIKGTVDIIEIIKPIYNFKADE